MKKFRFTFDSILTFRKTLEESSLRKLGEAQRVFQAQLAQKKELENILKDALERRQNLGIDPIGVFAFQLEQNFIVGTKQRIIQAEAAIVRANRGVEKALRSFLMARRETRKLELLYEKQFVQFKKERTRREQMDQDDLSVMRNHFKEEQL
ncbi:flagellar export protein FliJ [Bdellovibrionota bacterium FG-2]